MKIVRLVFLASLAMVATARLHAQTRSDAATVPLGLAGVYCECSPEAWCIFTKSFPP
jgi:hypothetical protein